MKKNIMSFAIFVLLGLPAILKGQDSDRNIIVESEKAKTAFIETDKLMESLFENAYGYVIFPNVGKAAFVVGGAGGKGAVYEKGKNIGTAKMVQISVGLQLGGQRYREVIFFEDKKALDRFKENKLEFAAQASAIAAEAGASANVKYRNGVMIFTQGKDGLMLEAAVGGQKFTYTPLKNL